MQHSRRQFLKQHLSSGILFCMLPNTNALTDILQPGDAQSGFLFPIDGDILHALDGNTHSDGQSIVVKVLYKAPENSAITINHTDAVYNSASGVFEADVTLKKQHNTLVAKNKKTGSEQKIDILYAPHFAGGYRLSVDDNIWFLKDLTVNKDKYTSIFDTPFLAVFKRLHEKYGTKVHFNLFYQTDGFDLSQMTDKYKKEWKANADWIRLSFHANSEFPDRPYLTESYDKVATDCKKVLAEIKRFAGEELMAKVTTLHWGASNVEGARALRDIRYKSLVGYFNADDDQEPVAYYLTKEQIRHLKKRFVWHDNKENLSFVRSIVVVDTKKYDELLPYLDAQLSPLPFAEFLVHEQYFYSYYKNYQPDYEQKLFRSIEWAHQKGFTPAFLFESLA